MRQYVLELTLARHKWAHQERFSTDKTYRVLDTAERLLRHVDAQTEMAAVYALKLQALWRLWDETLTDETLWDETTNSDSGPSRAWLAGESWAKYRAEREQERIDSGEAPSQEDVDDYYASFSEGESLTKATEALESADAAAEKAASELPTLIETIIVEDITDVTSADNGTLEYMGHQVLVYIRHQLLEHDGSPVTYKFHVAECTTLESARKDGRLGRYVATSRKDGIFLVSFLDQDGDPSLEAHEIELGVCTHCLKVIGASESDFTLDSIFSE